MTLLINVLLIVVSILALIAALTARSIWRLVSGELADSWRWILPGFAFYFISMALRLFENFRTFEPILGRLEGASEIIEMVFLILVVIGLARQYRLFATLSSKD